MVTVLASKSVFVVFTLFHGICHFRIRSFIANDKDITNRDGEIFKTEGHDKAAKYWPPGRCGKKAALCPWLAYSLCLILGSLKKRHSL